MKKEFKTVLIVMAVALIGLSIFLKPWLTSDEKLQNDILKRIPIGTDWHEALEVVDSQKKWQRPTNASPENAIIFSRSLDSVGMYRMRVRIKHGHFIYRKLFATYAMLDFDEDLMLCEVRIGGYMRI
ncbi:MAG: hypothetical protein FWG87_06235 [Defluviitaleaceae bacterium]|nr:hypothetical protein [Defluviitaleaceae bacterium]